MAALLVRFGLYEWSGREGNLVAGGPLGESDDGPGVVCGFRRYQPWVSD